MSDFCFKFEITLKVRCIGFQCRL